MSPGHSHEEESASALSLWLVLRVLFSVLDHSCPPHVESQQCFIDKSLQDPNLGCTFVGDQLKQGRYSRSPEIACKVPIEHGTRTYGNHGPNVDRSTGLP